MNDFPAPALPIDPAGGVDLRPRVVRRLREAGAHPVTVILASAGSGKSVALQQFLDAAGPHTRIDLPPGMPTDHFARELSGAVQAGATRIAVDGLNALGDPASGVATLVDQIQRTKAGVYWIVASRSAVGLPIGTWLAYGDCELVVEGADLSYTREEIADAALRFGFGLADEELDNIVSITEGWPAAVGVALRFASHAQDGARMQSTVREAAYRFFHENVFPGLTHDERELLAVAAAQPEIDARLLELAGFPQAQELIEAIRQRTMLFDAGPDRTYRCLGLFRRFLRRQIDVAGSSEIRKVYAVAARGLELAGRTNDALDAFVSAKAETDVLRLLEKSGFDLLERGQSAAIARAVTVLGDADKRSNPHVLALRGVLQSLAGDPVSAEALLRRAVVLSGNESALASAVSIRLALLLTNQGREIDSLLEPIAKNTSLSAADRAEAWSLMAARAALAGSVKSSKESMGRVDSLLNAIESESIRARVLQRVGVAAAYVGDIERSRAALSQAASLAMELGLFSLASRAYANLSNLTLHHFDDITLQERYAELAFTAAVQAKDAFDIETASLQLLDAELRSGTSTRIATLERNILDARTEDRSRTHYLMPARALRLAWEGRFAEAHRILGPSWPRLHHDLDQAVTGAQYALYLALDEKRELSLTTTTRVQGLLESIVAEGPFSSRSVAVARLCCALAEAINGRRTRGEKTIRQLSPEQGDVVISLLRAIGERMLAEIKRRNRTDVEALAILTEQLHPLGYKHVAHLLDSVSNLIEARKPSANGPLSPAESGILTLLADGLSPKEIASRRGSSISTVRKQIARSIVKLRCNGRAEAIALSRRLGLLTEPRI